MDALYKSLDVDMDKPQRSAVRCMSQTMHNVQPFGQKNHTKTANNTDNNDTTSAGAAKRLAKKRFSSTFS